MADRLLQFRVRVDSMSAHDIIPLPDLLFLHSYQLDKIAFTWQSLLYRGRADISLKSAKQIMRYATYCRLVSSDPKPSDPNLIELSASRVASEGQQIKMELVYQYLTGPRFRHRVEAIVERFSVMQEDLDRERKATMRLWAKREEQIRGVIEATAGMYGDLQGIAGRTLQEIEGLEMPLLDAPVVS